MKKILISPTISVIMSIYNEQKEWLIEAIDSILNQTFSDFEFIIINDNPERELNDAILTEYQSKDKRIVIITNKVNIGLTKSLNIGFKLAKGKYIARMDADDISHPSRFKIQVHELDNLPNVGLVGTFIELFNENKKLKTPKSPITNEEIKSTLFFENCIAHPSIMLKREIIDENGEMYNETIKYAQDYELWVKLSKKTNILNINKKLLSYRVHENQITSASRFNQNKFAFEVCLSQMNKIKIIPDLKEKELHYLIVAHIPYTQKYSLSDYECWLLKIKTQNELHKIFEPEIFNKIISKKFLSIIYKYPTSFENLVIYQKSELIINRYKLKLIVKLLATRFKNTIK